MPAKPLKLSASSVLARFLSVAERRRPSGKPSFGQDVVEAMKLILAHHCGGIELDRVLPKRRLSQAAGKQYTPRPK